MPLDLAPWSVTDVPVMAPPGRSGDRPVGSLCVADLSVSGQLLLATSGQNPVAANIGVGDWPRWLRVEIVSNEDRPVFARCAIAAHGHRRSVTTE
jgi:hypothetical protein